MRLSKKEVEVILSVAQKHFGLTSKVYLFGSRVDDEKKGGDIDLYIQSNTSELLTLEIKAHFLAELKKQIGDQQIDVVLDTSNTRNKSAFYQSIVQHCIELN